MKTVRTLFAIILIVASSTENSQAFDIDKYINDALNAAGVSSIGTKPTAVDLQSEAVKSFNDKYLTVRRGTSQVDRPHWLFPDEIYYGDNSATANLLALNLGLVAEECRQEVLKNLITNIIRINGGHIIADPRVLPILLPTLSAEGRTDVASLLTSRDSSALAPFIPQWRREVIAGIQLQENGSAIRMEPDFSIAVMEDMDESCDSPLGPVRSRWHKDLMHADWYVSLPEGIEAEAVIPVSDKSKIRHSRGIKYTGKGDGFTIWKVKGGSEKHFSISFEMPEHIVEEQFLFEKHEFPCCHSSSITQLSNGDLLAVFTGGQNEAAPDTRVYMTRKENGTDFWTPLVEMTPSSLGGPDKYSTYNPVIFQEPGGQVLLFYHISKNAACYLMRSDDLGHSWSTPELLPEGIKGPERAQPLISGNRMICPGDLHQPYRIRPAFYTTEDNGRSWSIQEPSSAEYGIASNNRKPGRTGENFDIPADDIPRERAFEIMASIQPAILVHSNGLMQALTRTCHGKLGCVWSYDGGKSWGHEHLTDFPNNNSGFSAITLKDGRFAMVCNDFESLPGAPRWEHMNARTPLSLFISEDGIKWDKIIDIEDGPIHNNKFPSGYCYPNIIEGEDNCLHLVYTWQRRRIKYVKIRL